MLDVHPEQDGPRGRGDDHTGQQEDEQELLNLRFNVIDDPGRQLLAFRIGTCDVNDAGARSVAEQQQRQDQEDNHDSFARHREQRGDHTLYDTGPIKRERRCRLRR